jgi:hypothetical protein
MKICAYCTTRNRDEAIFCSHCRRPLRGSRIPRDRSLLWFLAVVILIGLGLYLFLSRSSLSFAPSALAAGGTPTPGPSQISARESVTLYACVEYDSQLRRGPSTQSETTGELKSGTCVTVVGRTEDSKWVYMVSNDHQTGWVSAELLPQSGTLDRISVRDNSALANAARATLTSSEIAYGARAFQTMVAATNVVEAPLSSYAMPCFDAVDRVGDFVSCKLERAYCDYLPDIEGSPTFCNDRPAPDHNFALVASGMDWSEYDGQCLIVEGYLEIDQGVLKIQALRRDQVSSCT